jgi:predicted dehydrogenase
MNSDGTGTPPSIVTKLKAAVIGLGFVGAADEVSGDAIGQSVGSLDGTHAQALAGHPAVDLVAGASRGGGRRERFQKRLGVQNCYADWRQMLAREKLDLVSIATNSPAHAEIAIAAAQAGVRAILCEKPIATRLSDADRMIQVCRENNVLLAVNHNRRWHPFWHAVRDELKSGAIGQIECGHVCWSSGRLGNMGTHFFDLLRMQLGANAVEVSGCLDPVVPLDCRGADYHDPGGWGVIAFENGIKTFIHAAQPPKRPALVQFVGTDGVLNATGDRAVIERWSGGRLELAAPAVSGTSVDRAVDDLVRCLSDGTQPACTAEDGLAALEIIIAFHVSHRAGGQWIKLPIQAADRELEVRIG